MKTFPRNAEGEITGHALLNRFPNTEDINVAQFVEGSRKEFDETYAKVLEHFRGQFDILRDWAEFAESISSSDDAVKYVEEHNLYFPLGLHLFPTVVTEEFEAPSNEAELQGLVSLDGMLQAESMPSMLVGGSTHRVPPRQLLSDSRLYSTDVVTSQVRHLLTYSFYVWLLLLINVYVHVYYFIR